MKLIMKKCPTAMCHASTILKLDQDKFIVAWFGGTKEGMEDVAIWIARGNEKHFEEPVILAQSNEAHWNPVLFRIDEKKIIIFYKVGNEIGSWRTMYRISEDNGESFGAEKELVKGDLGGRGPVRNKPIRLKNGRILAPGSTEQGIWKAFVDYSDDEGKTWRKSQEVEIKRLAYKEGERTVAKEKSSIPVSEQSFYGRGVIQPTLWETKPNQVHMLLRSTEGKIYRSDSEDGGETWTEAYATELPNNNSGIDMIQTEDGREFLVYNPVGVNWGERTPISLAVSSDNGETWKKIKDLSTGDGEFAYPAIIQDEEFLYITYTYKRENIAFCKIKK